MGLKHIEIFELSQSTLILALERVAFLYCGGNCTGVSVFLINSKMDYQLTELSEHHEIEMATKQTVTCSHLIQNDFARCHTGQETSGLHNGYPKCEQVIPKI